MATPADRAPEGRGPVHIDIAVLDDRWQGVPDLYRLAEDAALNAIAHGGVGSGPAELSLVFSTDERVRELNADYRGKSTATNVLSFPADQPGEQSPGQDRLLGDVVVAFETISEEAEAQGKTFENHLCHLIVHGILHLLGYDHEVDSSADKMEALEIAALAHMNVPNPYRCDT